MASEHNISQAWLGLLDAERLTRYYQAVTRRLQVRCRRLTGLERLGNCGILLALLSDAPGVAILLAATVLGLGTFNSSHSYYLAEATSRNCADLALCWRTLWVRLNDLDETDAWREIQSLKRREEAATAKVPARLTDNERLNERCAKDAYAILSAEYANAI